MHGLIENNIARDIVDICYHIHKRLGPGLLESVYEEILVYEITKRKYFAKRQIPIPLIYDSIKLNLGFRADLIIENKVIIEVKAIELILPVHKMQLLTYLKITDLKLGLLINTQTIKEGITRVVNRL